MADYFSPEANTIFRRILLGLVLLVVAVSWGGALIVRSPYENFQGIPSDSINIQHSSRRL